MTNIKAVRPEWTFKQAVKNVYGFYVGRGLQTRQLILGHLRQWASLVGRERAVRELDSFISAQGGIEATAKALGYAASTIKKLRIDFSSVTTP